MFALCSWLRHWPRSPGAPPRRAAPPRRGAARPPPPSPQSRLTSRWPGAWRPSGRRRLLRLLADHRSARDRHHALPTATTMRFATLDPSPAVGGPHRPALSVRWSRAATSNTLVSGIAQPGRTARLEAEGGLACPRQIESPISSRGACPPAGTRRCRAGSAPAAIRRPVCPSSTSMTAPASTRSRWWPPRP